MEEAKAITVEFSEEEVAITLSPHDGVLLELLFGALGDYVKRGWPLKIKRISLESQADTAKIKTTMIVNAEQMEEWGRVSNEIIAKLRKERRA